MPPAKPTDVGAGPDGAMCSWRRRAEARSVYFRRPGAITGISSPQHPASATDSARSGAGQRPFVQPRPQAARSGTITTGGTIRSSFGWSTPGAIRAGRGQCACWFTLRQSAASALDGRISHRRDRHDLHLTAPKHNQRDCGAARTERCGTRCRVPERSAESFTNRGLKTATFATRALAPIRRDYPPVSDAPCGFGRP